ncbi:hypothetical protein [Demequina maris]|uniref:hypothetical protein n=1 Tax=Demequina maris TaxID=1638982 RepID=UPI000B2E7768|nr:hypothetical protein [Demequina maris]
MSTRRRDDAGAGSIVAVAIALAALVAVVALAAAVGAVGARAQAQAAADAAALAGAREARAAQARASPGSPAGVCATAAAAAGRAGGVLVRCVIDARDAVTVTVEVRGREASARAGRKVSAAARAEGGRTAADGIPASGRLRDRAAVRKSIRQHHRHPRTPIQYGESVAFP